MLSQMTNLKSLEVQRNFPQIRLETRSSLIIIMGKAQKNSRME